MKQILVIDDEEHLLELYRSELMESGYQVHTALNAEEVFSLLEEMTPDLVVLDIKLGSGPGGIEILRKLKERSQKLPVIMNTAYSEFKQDFGVWASDDYIVKSSDLAELKEKIAFFLKTDPH